jgi:hypothetical protein
MKEIKDCQLKFRLTAEQKRRILEYCEKHDMNVSEFIRFACE